MEGKLGGASFGKNFHGLFSQYTMILCMYGLMSLGFHREEEGLVMEKMKLLLLMMIMMMIR